MKLLAIDKMEHITGNEYRLRTDHNGKNHYRYLILTRCRLCGEEMFQEKPGHKKGHAPQCGCGVKPKFICSNCGKQTTGFKHKESIKKFCSRRCYYDFIKLENNPNWKGGHYANQVDERMRSLININLRRNGDSILLKEMAGYSVADIKKHIEDRFKPGMSWKNREEWHIDHIIPRHAFNYHSERDIDFKRCWAMKNLQPEWATDNLKKGKKLRVPFQPFLNLEV